MRVLLLSVLACFFLQMGVAQNASQKEIDSLKRILRNKQQTIDKITVYNAIGEAYTSVNLDSARAYFQIATRLSNKHGVLNEEVKSYLGMSQVYNHLVKYDSAQVYIEKAELLIEQVKDYDLINLLYRQKGGLFFYIGEYKKAKQYFEKGLNLAENENSKEDIAKYYNNISLCLEYLGDYEAALKLHINSAELSQSLNDSLGLARSYNNIGLLHKSLKNYDKAETYLKKSLALKEQIGNTTGVIGALLNLGNLFRQVGMKNEDFETLSKARDHYERSLKLSQEINYVRGISHGYLNLALIETTTENYDKGVAYGKKAVAYMQKINDRNKEMYARINLGDTYRYTKQYGLAATELEKSLQLAEEFKELELQKQAKKYLSLVYQGQGDYKKALEYYQAQQILEDSIASTDIKNRINELEIKYETQKKERDLAETRANLVERELEVEQKNTLIFGSLGLALVLGLLGYLLYNQQKLKNRQLKKESELKNALAKIVTQNKLQEERLRISRDLHDNIGSQLSFIISSLDTLKYRINDENSPVSQKLSDIGKFTSETIYELRDTIWAMNKTEITFEDLEVRIHNFMKNANASKDFVQFSFEVSKSFSKQLVFSSVKGMNLYRIIQEAVNNSLKHSNATKIDVHIDEIEGAMAVKIVDNGKGFDLNEVSMGNGLNNIEMRAKKMGGTAMIDSVKDRGTRVMAKVPI